MQNQNKNKNWSELSKAQNNTDLAFTDTIDKG